MKLFVTFAALASTTEAYTTLFKTCPTTTIPTKNPFDLSAYAGRWYEIQHDVDFIPEWMAECPTATYTSRSDGNIDVSNRCWTWWTFFSYQKTEGQAKCADGKCFVNFNPFSTDLNGKTNYNVLLTDYTSYSVVYSCSNTWLGTSMSQNLWVLSRTETMDDQLYNSLKT